MPVKSNKAVSDLEQVMMMIDDVDTDLRNDYNLNKTSLMWLNEIQKKLSEIHKSLIITEGINAFRIR
tara:strand:- start:1093 stop:1293 length:201 start_codon:yes stop_codon:yes gene_type:complete